MATYDETIGNAAIPWNKEASGGFFRLEHSLNAATAIANHATPTAAGHFAVNDVLQLIDFPAGCVMLYSLFRTVIVGTTSGATCDLGKNGGVEFDAGVALDASAGTIVVASVTDNYGDNCHAAADTADLEVLSQTMVTGSWVWSIVGIHGV